MEEIYAAWNKAVKGEHFEKSRCKGFRKARIMYIINGIAYEGEPVENMKITTVKPLDDMMMLSTFSTGETRLYYASQLLEYPAFQPLKDDVVFRDVKVEYGVVTWLDGDIDIAPETMYQNSYAYELMAARG